MSPLVMSQAPCSRIVPCKKRPWFPPSPSSACSEDGDDALPECGEAALDSRKDSLVTVASPRMNSVGTSPLPLVPTKRLSDFSIERILSDLPVAPRPPTPATMQTSQQQSVSLPSPDSTFEWLHCTRYRPPKLPRSRRRDSDGCGAVRRRRPGRGPRIPFAPWQIDVLEQRFQHGAYLGAGDVTSLAARLGLADTRVKIWFQNRRARERREGQNVSQTGNTRLPLTTPPKVELRLEQSALVLGAAPGSAFTAIRPTNSPSTAPCR